MRADEHAEHDGHGEARVDVAAVEIDAGAGRGGDADHEIAGGGGDFERQAHGAVHGQDLHRAGADAQQAGKNAGNVHQAEAGRDVAHVVFDWPASVG